MGDSLFDNHEDDDSFEEIETDFLNADLKTDLSSPEAIRDLIQLSLVPDVGPATLRRLLQRFGTPQAALDASRTGLEELKLTPKVVAGLLLAKDRSGARQVLEECGRDNIRVLTPDHRDYPRRLNDIDRPPLLLFAKGQFAPADELSVAIVGSRHPSVYGEQVVKKLAAGLARAAVTIVSGLARGIDGLAHRATLEAGGRTIAVLGGGLSKIYPKEHGRLAEQVAESGVLLSEYPPSASVLAQQFPARNRIISGMSLATLVIEASEKSGSLHTARHAMEQNRDVLAVPGRIDSDASSGCHRLIRDGATLARNVEDVLEALGHLPSPVVEPARGHTVHQPRELLLSEQEQRLLNLIATEATAVDDVVTAAGIEPARVLSTLTVLEMKKLLRRLPGNFVVRIT